jgi:phosphohistidine phosphatase
MDLYVLRHGVAEERSTAGFSNDDQRPLTAKGARRMARQVRGLQSLGVSIDVIISSPLARAVQTAEIVHEGLRMDTRLVTSNALAPNGSPSQLVSQLATGYSSTEDVMVVGHEPSLSSLISVLTTGNPEPVVRLRKGALCKLRLPAPRYGRCGWIEWSMTPKQMVNLG